MGKNHWDISKKTCLITGANSGIGKATAIGLARKNAHIIIACRNTIRGEEAVQEIKEKSENEKIDLMIVDLASLDSIYSFAEEFKNKYDRLDILINNAGVHLFKRKETIDGFEENFFVNFLAPFLLTNLLLGTLKKSSPSRVINVTSRFFVHSKINFDDLQSKNYIFSYKKGALAYSLSKHALTLFTFELAKKLKDSNTTVNCYCPGSTSTNLVKDQKQSHPIIIKLFSKLIYRPKKPEKAAKTAIYLASSPDVQNITGKFFQDKKEMPKYQKYYDEDTSKKLWKIGEKLTHLKS